ncbi:MAG TPA: hypothetical protein VNL14_03855 [Candidatus Acidoferrales bacterium]|nr:hypothetical protein [Candidatus Acidoferrales bacterium]
MWFRWRQVVGTGLGLALLIGLPRDGIGSHSWGGYHWARTSNPFTLQLGDNVSTAWDLYLDVASSDWTLSSVLDTTIVAGRVTNPKNCKPTSGRVEVCSARYGFNGWLGVASIWISGKHITQGTVKLNDTYFDTPKYNTPAWRLFVMCQEVGHTFGLDHQDENFSNGNLGSCMDYTSDPDGTLADPDQLSNERPNQHDYDQIGQIYTHLDSSTTVSALLASGRSGGGRGTSETDGEASVGTGQWGKLVRSTNRGRTEIYELELGKGQKIVTFVLWADPDIDGNGGKGRK